MHYRLMTIEDYEQVYALWLSCRGMGLNDVDDSREGIRRFLERNPQTCFVAEENQEILGVILGGNDGRRGYIHHTAVSPRARHQGIGSQLVTLTLDAFREIGITKVALVVFQRNQEGNAFWEKQGFSVRNDLTYRNKTLVQLKRLDT